MRPWAETFRSSERNGALHWDFIHLGQAYGAFAYLLVLKDDATHYCELVPCASPTSVVAAEAILDWHSRFGAPLVWISDNGSHFKNEVLKEVCRRLKCQQRFVLAYCPWINGSVERLNRDIVQVLRVLCLEYKVDIKDWTFFVPVLQANLNHTPLPSLGNKAPVELFCVLPAVSAIDFCLDKRQKELVHLGELPEQIEQRLEQLRHSVLQLHKKVVEQRENQTRRNQKERTARKKPNFDVGDYVLRSRVDQKYQSKLLVTWVGPYQVIKADEYSFTIRHLVTGAESDVHSSRLKFYADDKFEVTEEVLDHVPSQGIILTVDELKDHRWNKEKKEFELLVGWRGLEPIEDSWESLSQLAKDIPVLIKAYVKSQSDPTLDECMGTLKL